MKTAYTLLGLTLGIALNTQAQNVGINTDGSTPDGDAILHIKNDASSSKDSSVVRIENEQNGANDVTGVEIYNSGTGATAKWDVLIPASGSTDLRISNNGTDRVTIQNDGDVGIGTTSPASGLDIQSSMGYKVNTITSATTLDNTYNVVLCNTGPYTVTLPAAASNTGRVYYIKNIDTDGDDITIDGNASETINGSATYSLESYNHVVQIISDGTNWHIIEEANKAGGSITGTLTCASSTDNGTLQVDVAASGVSSDIPYTGGNCGTHSGQTVASTGATGLTATLSSGSFNCGSGNLTYNITGTPASSGTASFAINIGGKTCTLDRTVETSGPSYPAGTVHCNGTPTEVVDVTNPTTGRTWMDRNLGASQVASAYNDANSYGDYYQWGRFSDGHQCKNSDVVLGPGEMSSSDTVGHGKFISVYSGYYDWRNPQNHNLWQGVNGINNPCPSGYRLPTDAELTAESATWSPSNKHGAFASVLKWSVAGRRNYYPATYPGALYDLGVNGRYWSSTVSGTNAGYVWIGTSVIMSTNYRSYGNAVRCIKD